MGEAILLYWKRVPERNAATAMSIRTIHFFAVLGAAALEPGKLVHR